MLPVKSIFANILMAFDKYCTKLIVGLPGCEASQGDPSSGRSNPARDHKTPDFDQPGFRRAVQQGEWQIDRAAEIGEKVKSVGVVCVGWILMIQLTLGGFREERRLWV